MNLIDTVLEGILQKAKAGITNGTTRDVMRESRDIILEIEKRFEAEIQSKKETLEKLRELLGLIETTLAIPDDQWVEPSPEVAGMVPLIVKTNVSTVDSIARDAESIIESVRRIKLPAFRESAEDTAKWEELVKTLGQLKSEVESLFFNARDNCNAPVGGY